MTKQELLKKLALECVNYAEGSDFEMKELIHEQSGDMLAALREHYPEMSKKYVEPDEAYDDPEGAHTSKFYEKVQKDISDYIRSLVEPSPLVALYACGSEQIEIGRYSAPLAAAEEAFLTEAAKFNLDVKVKASEFSIHFTVKEPKKEPGTTGPSQRMKFIYHIADAHDVKGDPPEFYILAELNTQKPYTYQKTGTYFD